MASDSKIEWTDATWNPWIGCTKVSPGCANCYAETEDGRRKWTPEGWGKGKARKRTSPAYWLQPFKWNREAKAAGVPTRVFCASLADVFDEEVPDSWRDDVFATIAATPWLTWQVLTKRPEKAAKYLTAPDFSARIHKLNFERRDWLMKAGAVDSAAWVRFGRDDEYEMPLPNLWLGTSVENQKTADERIPHLLQVPAVVRFLSCEPLLGLVDLSKYLEVEIYSIEKPTPKHWWSPSPAMRFARLRDRIGWVIVGGESGAKARPFCLDWATSLRQQCQDAGVSFFMKQMGCNPVRHMTAIPLNPPYWTVAPGITGKGLDMEQWPEELRVRQFPQGLEEVPQ